MFLPLIFITLPSFEPNSILSVPVWQLVQRREIKMTPNIFFMSLLSGETCPAMLVHNVSICRVAVFFSNITTKLQCGIYSVGSSSICRHFRWVLSHAVPMIQMVLVSLSNSTVTLLTGRTMFSFFSESNNSLHVTGG